MPRGHFQAALARRLRLPGLPGGAHCVLTKRVLYQCNACKLQTSLTAGTIFAATKLGLTVWFRAMYHMTQSK